MSGVQQGGASEEDRPRGGDPVQGVWVLSNGLPERVVQEGGEGGGAGGFELIGRQGVVGLERLVLIRKLVVAEQWRFIVGRFLFEQ